MDAIIRTLLQLSLLLLLLLSNLLFLILFYKDNFVINKAAKLLMMSEHLYFLVIGTVMLIQLLSLSQCYKLPSLPFFHIYVCSSPCDLHLGF
jgi:hypothetical protein